MVDEAQPVFGLSMKEITASIVAGELSAVEITAAYIDRIRRVDADLHSFVSLCEDRSLMSAQRIDEKVRAGGTVQPLAGVPFTVKDLISTKWDPNTMGVEWYTHEASEEDSVVVQRLEAAGAVLVGRVNMDELALGVTGENRLYPRTRNPWDSRRITGGSSAGSGAAVAAGLCPLSVGTDTAGSVRVPAAVCGVYGMKPTFGRIPRSGVRELSWTLDHVATVVGSARDLMEPLNALSGFDAEDVGSLRWVGVETKGKSGRGKVCDMRACLCVGGVFSGADPEFERVVVEAGALLESLGADVNQKSFDWDVPSGIISVEGAVVHAAQLRERPEALTPRVREMLLRAAERPATVYGDALRRRAVLRREFELLFESYDLLLTPAIPDVAPYIDDVNAENSGRMTRYTGLMNLVGVPALTMPLGSASSGGPIAVQIAAAWGEEEKLVAVATALESVRSPLQGNWVKSVVSPGA